MMLLRLLMLLMMLMMTKQSASTRLRYRLGTRRREMPKMKLDKAGRAFVYYQLYWLNLHHPHTTIIAEKLKINCDKAGGACDVYYQVYWLNLQHPRTPIIAEKSKPNAIKISGRQIMGVIPILLA
jgi:hypothetical protein